MLFSYSQVQLFKYSWVVEVYWFHYAFQVRLNFVLLRLLTMRRLVKFIDWTLDPSLLFKFSKKLLNVFKNSTVEMHSSPWWRNGCVVKVERKVCKVFREMGTFDGKLSSNSLWPQYHTDIYWLVCIANRHSFTYLTLFCYVFLNSFLKCIRYDIWHFFDCLHCPGLDYMSALTYVVQP